MLYPPKLKKFGHCDDKNLCEGDTSFVPFLAIQHTLYQIDYEFGIFDTVHMSLPYFLYPSPA